MTHEEWEKKVAYALKVLKEQWRLSKNPLTQKQMLQIRYTLHRDLEKAQQLEKDQRYDRMFALLYERFHFLNNHFLVWEEERENDRRWKEEIEKRLNSFMEQATQILTSTLKPNFFRTYYDQIMHIYYQYSELDAKFCEF